MAMVIGLLQCRGQLHWFSDARVTFGVLQLYLLVRLKCQGGQGDGFDSGMAWG